MAIFHHILAKFHISISIHYNPTHPSAQQAAFSVNDETWHG